MSEPTGAARRRGPFKVGDQVQLTDPKGRHYTFTLEAGKNFHTHKGSFPHDELIGAPEGSVVRTTGNVAYLALRPLLPDYVLSMPRGAAVVYPKDAGQILAFADIFPGARVVEAGVGSGSLSSFLLRAIGDQGMLHSYERREDFAEIAPQNVERYFGGPHPAWQLTVGDLQDNLSDTDVDRVILDMLAPWECLEAVSKALVPGGILCCYVATTTQLARTVESIREIGCFNEPSAWESMIRNWHVEGLAVRPDHRMIGHTGFLLTARRLADGVEPPMRRRRPAKGAYGEDYTGPSADGGAGDRGGPAGDRRPNAQGAVAQFPAAPGNSATAPFRCRATRKAVARTTPRTPPFHPPVTCGTMRAPRHPTPRRHSSCSTSRRRPELDTLAHTRPTLHWLATATALAGVVATARPPSSPRAPRTARPKANPPRPPAPDPAGGRSPSTAGPRRPSREGPGDLDGDGRPETVAVVHCDASMGTPPDGVYVLTRSTEAARPAWSPPS